MRQDLLKAAGMLMIGVLVYWFVTRHFHLQELIARGAYVRVDAQRRPYLLALSGPEFNNRDLSLLHTIPTLQRVSLRDCTIDDDGVAPLTRLPELLEVDLSGTAVTDAAVSQLAGIPTLERLTFDGCSGMTAAGLAELTRLDRLKRLAIRRVTLDYGEYCDLQSRLPDVKIRADPSPLLQLGTHSVWRATWFREPRRECGTIRLSPRVDVRRITTEALSAIAWPEAIAAIDFGVGTALDPDVLESLAGFPKLQSLSIDATIDDEDFAVLCRLPKLKHLQIGSSTITDAGLAQIPSDTPLESLTLRTDHISAAGLEAISRCRRLRSLDLSHQPVEPAGLDRIGELSKLTRLALIDCGLSDRSVEFLRQIKTLKYVDLRSNPLTTLPVEVIASLPDLRILDLRNTSAPEPDPITLENQAQHRLVSSSHPLLLRFWYNGMEDSQDRYGQLPLTDPYAVSTGHW